MRVIESSCLVLLLHSFGAASAFQCHSLTSPLLSTRLHRHPRSTVDAVARKQNVGSLWNNIPWQTKQSPLTTLEMADCDNRPQAFITGYSTNPSLLATIKEATKAGIYKVFVYNVVVFQYQRCSDLQSLWRTHCYWYDQNAHLDHGKRCRLRCWNAACSIDNGEWVAFIIINNVHIVWAITLTKDTHHWS